LRGAEFLGGASEVSHAQSPLFALDQDGVLVANLDELAKRTAVDIDIAEDRGRAVLAAAGA
jgi:hypothetical protein